MDTVNLQSRVQKIDVEKCCNMLRQDCPCLCKHFVCCVCVGGGSSFTICWGRGFAQFWVLIQTSSGSFRKCNVMFCSLHRGGPYHLQTHPQVLSQTPPTLLQTLKAEITSAAKSLMVSPKGHRTE